MPREVVGVGWGGGCPICVMQDSLGLERSFPTQTIVWICNTFVCIIWLDLCYIGTVAGDATALRHWQGRGHCSCPKPLGQTLPWEHLFPHSKAPRWEEPCDREMVTPCHLPRDSWAAGDQGNENLVELSLGMARGKQSCWFADFPGWPTNSKTIKARDTFLRSDPAQQSQGKIPTELNSHWTAATTVTYSQDLFIIPPWF